MDLSLELLEIAERDLKACRILHKNKLYPQAIFYFAQSVEKANKSLDALTGNHDERYFSKKIGHESINIHQKNTRRAQQKFNRMVERSKKEPLYKELPFFEEDKVKEMVKQCDFEIKNMDLLKQQKEILLNISLKDINESLTQIKKTKKKLEKGVQRISESSVDGDEWLKNISNIKDIFPENDELKEASLKIVEDLKTVNFGFMWESVKHLYIIHFKNALLVMPLYYLSVITLPHATITRYPENGKSPLGIFTRKLPIVRKLPELIKVHSEALNDLRDFHILWNDLGNKFSPDLFIVEA